MDNKFACLTCCHLEHTSVGLEGNMVIHCKRKGKQTEWPLECDDYVRSEVKQRGRNKPVKKSRKKKES